VLEAGQPSASSGKGRGGVGVRDLSEYDRTVVQAAEALEREWSTVGRAWSFPGNSAAFSLILAVRAKREVQQPTCQWIKSDYREGGPCGKPGVQTDTWLDGFGRPKIEVHCTQHAHKVLPI
jgi:hypothetical protein